MVACVTVGGKLVQKVDFAGELIKFFVEAGFLHNSVIGWLIESAANQIRVNAINSKE